MSDPVTNAEVEDVLSSIRRLVSEEKRPVPAAKPVPKNDRLVLTPALRIEEDVPSQDVAADETAWSEDQDELAVQDENEAQSAAYAQPEAENDSAEHLSDGASEQQASDSQSEVVEDDYAADPYNFDDENDLDGESKAPLTLMPEARSDAQWDEETKEEQAAEIAEHQPEAPKPTESKAATLSAKIEALETAIGGIEDDFEPDEAGTDAYSGTEPPALEWEDDLSDADLSPVQLMPEFAVVEDEASEEPTVEAFDDEDALAATETPEAPEEQPTAQDHEDQDDISSQIAEETVLTLERPIEEAVVAAAIAQTDADDQPFAFASDAPLIDEEALRDMVGEIVRSELQGALGERITRNVRKLVRREIHRALTTQDLE